MQGELLKKTEKVMDKTEQHLRQKNSQLKDILQKYRSNNRFCLDMCLCMFFLILIGVMVNILKKKDYV